MLHPAATGLNGAAIERLLMIKLAFVAAIVSILAACSSTSGSQSMSSRNGRANTSTMGAPDNMQNGGPGAWRWRILILRPSRDGEGF